MSGIAGKIDPFTGAVNSLLGIDKPPAVATPTAPATAIVTAQPAIAAGSKTSIGATPRARTRGARAASVLTADLGDSKLGG